MNPTTNTSNEAPMSDISKDNELFELCKEVDEKTGWNETEVWLVKQLIGKVPFRTFTWESISDKGIDDEDNYAPLYTSDYLLEKLPEEISNRRCITMDRGYVKGEPVWRFAYQNGSVEYVESNLVEAFADTPLKALLKLCLALKEAGEL